MITANPAEATADGAVSVNDRLLVLALVLLAGLSGLAVGYFAHQARASDAVEPELATLLRLMALIKLGLVVGAIWLVEWRLRQKCRPRLALGYTVALVLMASAPGLIWFMTALLMASGLFHVGLLLALVLAFRDDRFALKSAERATREKPADNFRD